MSSLRHRREEKFRNIAFPEGGAGRWTEISRASQEFHRGIRLFLSVNYHRARSSADVQLNENVFPCPHVLRHTERFATRA